jgi:hypothetical protein
MLCFPPDQESVSQMTMNAEQMAEKVRTARDAVSGLDEPLRTEAFKILLEKLLNDDAEASIQQKPAQRRSSSPKPKTRAGRQEAREERSSSSLQLDVATLKQLKSYSERFELQGSEQIAFVLANFAREHTDLESVLPVDIEYLYRQLVSQRVKVAPVNDAADWTRAMNWLTAPSRRKEWLARSGNGYIVSNSGLLRFHELEEAAEKKRAAASGT